MGWWREEERKRWWREWRAEARRDGAHMHICTHACMHKVLACMRCGSGLLEGAAADYVHVSAIPMLACIRCGSGLRRPSHEQALARSKTAMHADAAAS